MKVSLKRAELPGICSGLKANLKKFRGAKLAYAVVKNIKTLEAELETFESMTTPSEKYEAYDKARIALCGEHAALNEDGTPIIEDKKYKLLDEPAFNAAFEELKAEHKEAIDERLVQEEDFLKFYNDSAELELHSVNEDALNDDLTGDLVALILPFIE